MVALGYGKWVRADRIFALVPLEADERGEGRRTYVHVEGLDAPVVASRAERAILADVESALVEAAGLPRTRRARTDEERSSGSTAQAGTRRRARSPGQASLLSQRNT
jgi:hypothetical protein